MGQEADRTPLEFWGQTGPHLGGYHKWSSGDALMSHDEPSLHEARVNNGSIIARRDGG